MYKFFEAYNAIVNDFNEFFGTTVFDSYSVVDCRYKHWTDFGSQYCTIEYGDCIHDPHDYGIEIYGTSRWSSRGYTAVVGDNGCGNRDIYIFDNRMKVEA